MYLVHLRLRRTDGSPPCDLPERIGPRVRAAARAADGVEHVAVHGDARPYPVLGVYVIADRLEDAEANAARVWERTRASDPEFREWALVAAEAPFIAWFHPELFDVPAGSPDVPREPGHKRPGPFPSTGSAFSAD